MYFQVYITEMDSFGVFEPGKHNLNMSMPRGKNNGNK